jgi:hypothetical protein
MKWIVRGGGGDFLDRYKEEGLNSHKSPYLLVRLESVEGRIGAASVEEGMCLKASCGRNMLGRSIRSQKCAWSMGLDWRQVALKR